MCLWACVLASTLHVSSVLASNESSQGEQQVVQQSSRMNYNTDSQVNGYSSGEYESKAQSNENGSKALSPIYANVADSPSVVEATTPATAPIIQKATRDEDSVAPSTQPVESPLESPSAPSSPSAPFSPMAPFTETLTPNTVAPTPTPTPTPVDSTPQPVTAEPSTKPPIIERATTNEVRVHVRSIYWSIQFLQ